MLKPISCCFLGHVSSFSMAWSKTDVLTFAFPIVCVSSSSPTAIALYFWAIPQGGAAVGNLLLLRAGDLTETDPKLIDPL